MRKLLVSGIVGCLLCLAATATGQQAVTLPQDEVAELKKQVEVLKAEVARLRQENQLLRKMLTEPATPAAATPAPDLQQTEPKQPASQITEQQETGYWMTTSSRKRHNKTCRYYKNSSGRFCTKDEGIPCKICGG